MTLRDVLDHLTMTAVALEAKDDQLRLRALLDDQPITDEVIAMAREHKCELLAYARFARSADELLLESTRTLAHAWPRGCQPEEDDRWHEVERQLREAYWSLDLSRLKEAIAAREGVALEIFAAFRRERAV